MTTCALARPRTRTLSVPIDSTFATRLHALLWREQPTGPDRDFLAETNEAAMLARLPEEGDLSEQLQELASDRARITALVSDAIRDELAVRVHWQQGWRVADTRTVEQANRARRARIGRLHQWRKARGGR